MNCTSREVDLMKLKSTMVAALSVAGIGAALPAQAELDASIGVASEYVFRGLASGSPQVWGGLDYSHRSGAYGGVWVSNTSAFGLDSDGDGQVDSVADGNEEVDFYAGWGNGLVDLGAIYYAYPSQPSQGGSSITEIYAGTAIGPFTGYLWYAPAGVDGPDDDEYLYVDLNVDTPLTDSTSLGWHVGYVEPLGDAYEVRASLPESDPNFVKNADDGRFDFGVSLNIQDYFLALTYLEGSGGGFSTIVGYSWALPVE